ncbi:MAG: thioredoxin family protein [Gemmatimonadota bacterium]
MRHPFKAPALFGALLTAALITAPGIYAQTTTAHVKEDFTEARFAELQAQGAFILVDIFADWCPDCAQQQRVLAAYREAHPAVPLHTLVVNFDTQKDVVTRFRAPRQSTLILFRGSEQLWFTVAETREEVIVQALNDGFARR